MRSVFTPSRGVEQALYKGRSTGLAGSGPVDLPDPDRFSNPQYVALLSRGYVRNDSIRATPHVKLGNFPSWNATHVSDLASSGAAAAA